jgi:putative peptidoglycan lipid II flippase
MTTSQQPAGRPSALRSILQTLRPTHAHTAFTATILLTAAAFGSKIISLVRVRYILSLLGKTPAADAFNAMFQLPDTISYFLIGGATSITFVTMLTRYRASGREQEGEEALSVIFSTMMVVLGAAVVLAEILAPLYVRLAFPGFTKDPSEFALCVHLTRIILPGQLFFFGGGIFGAVLLARRQFTLQAFAPLIYNIGMILGGVLLFRYLKVSSIAWGGLAGVILGPFAVNYFGARHGGMRLRFRLDFRNAGLHEWFRKTLPLILGFSLVTVDSWIIAHFASHISGAVTLFLNAKQLFSVPQALGQAAGAASLPFLAALFGKESNVPFARSVNESVSRIVAVSILLSALLVPMAVPAVDFFFRGGLFHRSDATTVASYFAIFSLSLFAWSAQAIYARAFYAAGNTLTPMLAATAIVLLSLPVYTVLFQWMGAPGLAWASDIGITVQATAFAVLLHKRGMVPVRGLEVAELGRSLGAAVLSAGALYGLHYALPGRLSKLAELGLLAVSTLVWLGICSAVLHLSGSLLPGQLARRLRGRAAAQAVAST